MRSVIDAREFRRVLGHLPTGVTVITGLDDPEPVGMAANSVTSASLQPPLILFCTARTSETWPRIRRTGGFCVNVLRDADTALSRRFASKGVARFDGQQFQLTAGGRPVLPDVVAWIDCEIETIHPCGDHEIVVGRVCDLAAVEGDPLVFFRGEYRKLR